MWYFTWVLGLGFAVLLGILNALWFEAQDERDRE
jgi:cyd operon protein YbgT